MKRIAIPALLGLLLMSPVFGQTPPKPEKPRPERKPSREAIIDVHPKLLRITATIDGSGRFQFTRDSLKFEHKHWSRPTHVSIDGEPWKDLNATPGPWRDVADRVDLTKAWIVKREGRDTIALESTPDGFDLHVADSPNGAAEYSIVIAIPRLR